MSFISCPKCRKRISKEAPMCRHCGAKAGATRGAVKKNYSIHYLGATLLALCSGGVYLSYTAGRAVNSTVLNLVPYAFAAAIMWYIGVRIWSWMQ